MVYGQPASVNLGLWPKPQCQACAPMNVTWPCCFKSRICRCALVERDFDLGLQIVDRCCKEVCAPWGYLEFCLSPGPRLVTLSFCLCRGAKETSGPSVCLESLAWPDPLDQLDPQDLLGLRGHQDQDLLLDL